LGALPSGIILFTKNKKIKYANKASRLMLSKGDIELNDQQLMDQDNLMIDDLPSIFNEDEARTPRSLTPSSAGGAT